MTAIVARHPDTAWYTDGLHDRDWMAQAACRDHDPELWFPDRHGRGGSRANRAARRADTRYATAAAQRICLECPVAADCLHYALITDTRFGIWGGTTSRDRERLTGRRAYG